MSALRSSMITKPDPGPNYAKFMQEYTSSKVAGLVAEIKVEVEKHKGDLESQQTKEPAQIQSPDYAQVVCKAYEFFPTFKRLFVDLILSYKNQEDSQKYFEGLQSNDAYKLIKIELSWLYDILHSKGSVIYAFKHYGWVSRVITLVITTTALCLFAVSDHTGYGGFETTLTYVLLGGAVGLAILALVFMLLSFWTYAAMKESGGCCGLSERLGGLIKWPSLISLITYSFQNQPCWWKPIIKCVRFKETWDHYRYTTCVTVNKDLKNLVFQELEKKMKNIEDIASYRRFTDHKGQWALQRKGYYQEFGWSVEVEFDESTLLWHIATDLLFHDPGKTNWTCKERDISQHISNYMFLFIVRPFMMPAGIGQIRFGDTCAEAGIFLQQESDIEKSNAVKKILDVNTEYDLALVKGDRSKSVLFNGCRLAHKLKEQLITTENSEQDWTQLWRLISVVWVEILCYAASKCSGQFHAKQLTKRGELLTVIWFLMAHLGMGE
ncbi:hypothetical protein FCM35_KLT14978 [Carex littledalei]|uniref:DUF4220 domain-containing protein n=1 Tax=Carex littledalei TaxID=544730 RepID=A0A833QEP3_9POAL|nr:hypothetical protein FCM35_KLT14978 [Carex littledalei]